MILMVSLSFYPDQMGAQSVSKSELNQKELYVLSKINQVRTKGCKCGRKRMKPVKPLNWNKQLQYSAYLHAEEMDDYGYFAHRSIDGRDVGQRIDEIGYKWQFVGENLAEGQRTFDEALEDWMASKSHCTMIMNPNMKEMGLAKVGKYWVQHFGTLMPPKTKRVSTTYTEG